MTNMTNTKKKVKRYMHTIEGNPAYFEGSQIVYAGKFIRVSDMCSTLQQIRSQEKKSSDYRSQKRFPKTYYGYIIVYIDLQD